MNWQPQAPLTMRQHGKSKELLGYQAISHETIRQRLIARSEQAASVATEAKKPAKVLFVEVDGLYTKLQRSRRRVKENKIAIIHEGWERLGKRIQLKNKTHYLHTGSGSTFWEGFWRLSDRAL